MLSFSYHKPSTFLLHRINKPTIVEISAFFIEYQPMRVVMAFVLAPMPDKPSILWRIHNLKFTDIHLAVSQLWPCKVLPSIKKFGARSSFSSPPPPPLFQTVGGLRKLLLHLHTYICLPYILLISAWISIKFAPVIVLRTYVCTICEPTFSQKQAFEYLREASTLFIDYSHNMHSKQMICIKL